MNRLKPRKVLEIRDIHRLEHAHYEARKIGKPIDTFVTLRPPLIDPLEAPKKLADFWNWFRIWLQRRGLVFTCLLTREATPGLQIGEGEHWHCLVHLGSPDLRESLEKALRRRWTDPPAVDVREATYDVTFSDKGKLRSAFHYVTKQRHQNATHGSRENVSRRRGGAVYGKRWRVSANLRRKQAKPQNRGIVYPYKRAANG